MSSETARESQSSKGGRDLDTVLVRLIDRRGQSSWVIGGVGLEPLDSSSEPIPHQPPGIVGVVEWMHPADLMGDPCK